MRIRIKYFTALIAVLGALGASGQIVTYVDNSFTGATATGWEFTHTIGDGPRLTGGDIDPDGQGWLRLTEDKQNQNSFAYFNTPIPSTGGLIFTFDFVLYGNTTTTLGDGFSLVVFDAAVTPEPGAYGGALGYAQRSHQSSVQDGLAGAVIGIGFDAFGNFSNPTEGRVGGPGQRPNSVAIRGSVGADRMQGYEYITGTDTLAAFSTKTSDRENATIHTVRVTLPTDKMVHVEWHDGDGEWATLIGPYECDLTCPEMVKFGFTAGTGNSSMVQEIRNLSVTNIPEPGSVLLLSLAAGGGLWLRRRFTD